jgi:hypothetical protein
MDDIRALDDAADDEAYFAPVAALSTGSDAFYRSFVRPFVRAVVNEATAEATRQIHPLRTGKYGFSDLNPWMWPFKPLAEHARKNRRKLAEDNPFLAGEKIVSAGISDTLDFMREARDLSQELWFQSVWGNPWLQAWFKGKKQDERTDPVTCQGEWMGEVERGGFAEGVVRIMSALAHAGGSTDRSVLKAFREIARKDERLARLVSSHLAEAVKKQAYILAHDPDGAIEALANLLPDAKDRRAALTIARGIFPEGEKVKPEVLERLEAIQEVLEIEY